MTAHDLPDDLIESIQRAWGLTTRKDALVVADQLMLFLGALLDYGQKYPEAFEGREDDSGEIA